MADRVHDGNQTAAASATPLCLAALSDWVRCVCVVTFDLEFGQVMEVRTTRPVRVPPRRRVCRLTVSCVSAGLSGQRSPVRGGQDQPVLPGVSGLEFRLHGRHSVPCQDQVLPTVKSQSAPYQLQCQMSGFPAS